MESSITILEAPGSQVSRPLLKRRLQASINMFAVPRPPEPAGTMLRSEEGLDQTEHDITFVNRAEEDMRAEEYEEKKDRAEDTPTSSSVLEITPEEEQKYKNITPTTTPSVVECKMNRKGYCLTHHCQAEKRVMTSKVWKDRGSGRGFSYITKRVTK